MKIVQINATSGSGSTGKICESISKILTSYGIENYILYASGSTEYPLSKKYMNDYLIKIGALESRIKGNYGFNSSFSTHKLITIIDSIDPDIIHLHNIHSHNCDMALLFSYIKEKNKKTVWTFHDCWAFTGHCAYFTYSNCNRWLKNCSECIRPKEFSWFFNTTEKLLEKKKIALSDMDLSIVTPSEWLKSLVERSFLKTYKAYVINNGINLNVFYPREEFDYDKYGIERGKKIVLGVSFIWEERKGIDVFIKLSKKIDNDYQLVLVGTNDSIDKVLTSNIISIHRTNNQEELAALYSVSSVFLNPTREDNFPTVNMEALACGTPVITFNTGGSPEIIDDSCGIVVDDNIDSVVAAIIKVTSEDTYTAEKCVSRARQYDEMHCFEKYVSLYKRIMKNE